MKNYNTASINQVCKKSGIPKGSFYQYFTDKLDLYVYIMTLAIQEKTKFFSAAIQNFDSLSLSEQIHLLFSIGLDFAGKHPQYAALGKQFSIENDQTARAAVIKKGNKESEALFVKMINNAKARGEIDKSIDAHALSLLLQSLNSAINNYMSDKFGNTDYEDVREDVNSFVDSLLSIIFNGIKKVKKEDYRE